MLFLKKCLDHNIWNNEKRKQYKHIWLLIWCKIHVFVFREKFWYSEKHFLIQRMLFLFFVFPKMFIFKKILLCSIMHFLLYSNKSFIFRKKNCIQRNFLFRECLYAQRKILYSEKMLIFRENQEFRFQIVWDTVVGFR